MNLKKALKTLRKECIKHKQCSTCPLRNDDNYCAIQHSSPECYVFINNNDTPAERLLVQ